MNPGAKPDSLREQLEYYRARAGEYDEWWLRRGRYDRGEALNAQWFAEASAVSSALAEFRPAGRVLELACGTGIWTEQLLRFASQLTALDGSPGMLAINAARTRSEKVQYIEADIFQWQPDRKFDVVFFGFWLSHGPARAIRGFLETGRILPGSGWARVLRGFAARAVFHRAGSPIAGAGIHNAPSPAE